MVKWCRELTSKYVTLYVRAEWTALGEIDSFGLFYQRGDLG